MDWAVLILVFVTAQRLGELILARRNTRRLLARGGREAGAAHYPLIVTMHAAWLLGLWYFAVYHPPAALGLGLFWLGIFGLLQLARVWVIASLGERWTTRIIVLPGSAPVRRGPYRFLSHPNYWVVAGELFVLPLAFGLAWFGIVFSLLNAALMWIRIGAENEALKTQ